MLRQQTRVPHLPGSPSYALRPEQLTAFHVASPARPVSEKPDLYSTEYEKFEGRDGVTLSSRDPIVKAAMLHLSEVWPRSGPFEELRSAARARLEPDVKPDADAVAQDTQQLVVHPSWFDKWSASPQASLRACAGVQSAGVDH